MRQPCATGLVSWWNDLLSTIVARFAGLPWGQLLSNEEGIGSFSKTNQIIAGG